MKSESKLICRFLFGICALISATSANADIVQYSFKHSQTGSDTIMGSPGSTEYLSVKNTLAVYSSAGLDRKIRINLLNSSGDTVSSKEHRSSRNSI